jgi:hypothetical protein
MNKIIKKFLFLENFLVIFLIRTMNIFLIEFEGKVEKLIIKDSRIFGLLLKKSFSWKIIKFKWEINHHREAP